MERGINIPETVSNNHGTGGIGKLLENKQLHRIATSHVGENKEFARP